MNSRPVRLLRLVAAWAYTALYWTLAVMATLTTGSFRLTPRRAQEASRRWARGACRILGLRIELENASTLETEEPRVVIFNHQSALDMLWVAWTSPPGPLAMGKKELAWIPIVNLAWWALDYRLVDRNDPRRAAACLKGVPAEVAGGRSLLIAPEGTRSPDGAMLPFKKGAFVTAIRAQAPLYPVLVCGAYELLPKSGLLPRPGTIRLRYLPPVPTAGLGVGDAEALAQRLHAEMTAAYAGMVSRKAAPPPA